MPSTTSSSVSAVLASSTVMTPSLPTFCIACASIRPISVSPLAEMVPTWAISSLVDTFLARACRSLTTASTARSTPRLRSIGFMPAATDLAHHLRTHVLELVREFDLLGNRHAVLGHPRGAEALVEHHIAALGTERH